MEALRQPTIRVVAVIAEGVPEADTKQLIAYARQHNKVLIGPATVGGVQARAAPRPAPSVITLGGSFGKGPTGSFRSFAHLRCIAHQSISHKVERLRRWSAVRLCLPGHSGSLPVSCMLAPCL